MTEPTTWRDDVAALDDYRMRMRPLVDAILYEWGDINGGWDIEPRFLLELAWEAAHAVDHWLTQGEGPSHIPMVAFRNEIRIRETWKRRALDLGYTPEVSSQGEEANPSPGCPGKHTGPCSDPASDPLMAAATAERVDECPGSRITLCDAPDLWLHETYAVAQWLRDLAGKPGNGGDQR